MSDEFQLRNDVDRFRSFLDELEQTMLEYGVTTNDLGDFINQISLSLQELSLNNTCSEGTYRKLVELLEDYGLTSNDSYTLFRGDCWTINNNFESSAAITSETLTDFTVTGTFRTKADMVGIYWNCEDLIQHPYISYETKTDFSNVVLEFDYTMTGCREWNDDYNSTDNPVVLTINKTDGSIYYMVMYQFIDNGHVTIDFNNLYLHNGNTYIDSKGQQVTVTIDTKISVNNIKSIMLMLKPAVHNGTYTIINNVDFTCEVSNISVTNGYICKERVPLEPHRYRLCEGYDDFYNFNPKRICKEMRKLGYAEWVDLYIGASHYYEKSGTVNDVIDASDFNHIRTEKMVLDDTVPLNCAFESWLDCYCKELKANDVSKLIISVSMENLQCPTDWRQVDSNGEYAVTGWIPSTFFYSPCNDDVVDYMKSVSQACLDIVVSNTMQPILQMGEAWWWWNELDTPNQPPCFYDDATKEKYYDEFGVNPPEYSSSSSVYDSSFTSWLNQRLVDYSDELRSVVKSNRYSNGLYMALFFPPSVTDTDRVPAMMREVNYISNAYSPLKLDILQLEDYDWVTGESIHHNEVYSIGNELGFSNQQLHYYGGFVQYEKDAVKYWRLINDSMDTAFDKHFAEVFVWAGTQIRRDKKFIGYDIYEFMQYVSGGGMDLSKYALKSEIISSFNDLTDKPTIPQPYVHPSEKQCDYAYEHPSTQQCVHNHDERYYTETEVTALLSQMKYEIENKIVLRGSATEVYTGNTVDLEAHLIEDGIPSSGKTINFYKVS